MGGGCTCQSSSRDRIKIQKVGNFMISIYENKTVGKGCKRTLAWETSCTPEEVQKKIEEFWDTRVTGDPVGWITLKMACDEPDANAAQQIIQSAGMNLFEGSLSITFDALGNRYDLPPFVINPPVKYGTPKSSQLILAGNEVWELSLRCPKFDKDLVATVNSSDKVESLKSFFADTHKIELKAVRMFYNGKELKNGDLLCNYKLQNKSVLNVFLPALVQNEG
ncbi:UBTD2_2 [Blepharisma stoltei]|uniref:Ubiquitin-like domain-containing protein n=1 Tax=Blepharisma stoltei TaxID=1481888 RepID=A0AAU9INN3_9CILI|nr:unnamed protein product [Blepharisma stoltei]